MTYMKTEYYKNGNLKSIEIGGLFLHLKGSLNDVIEDDKNKPIMRFR